MQFFLENMYRLPEIWKTAHWGFALRNMRAGKLDT